MERVTMKTWGTSITAVAVVAAMATAATADTHGWDDGGADSNWSTPQNWKGDVNDVVPAASDIVHFQDEGTSGSHVESITVDDDVTVRRLRMKIGGTVSGANKTWDAVLTDDGNGRTLTVTDDLLLLYAEMTGGGVAHAQEPTARLYMDDLHVVVGSLTTRAAVRIGDNPAGSDDKVWATMDVDGGSFTAYLNTLEIGRADAGCDQGARGLLDLSGCTSVLIDIAGDAILGDSRETITSTYNGFQCNGRFRSGGGSVTVSGNLILADNRSGGTSGHIAGGYTEGRLDLANTTFEVKGAAQFNGRYGVFPSWNETKRARVYATVAGACSGLDLASSSSSALSFPLSTGNTSDEPTINLIDIKFTADPTETDINKWYWGMRWKGNHESVIEGYRGENYPRLKLDVSGLSDAVKREHLRYLKQQWPATYGSYTGIGDLQPNDYIVFDDDALGGTGYTYVGVCAPPPAGTVFMMR
jgi:hypothetical protein